MIADPADPTTQAAERHARDLDFQCGCDPLRQVWCHYHEGYMDGYDAAAEHYGSQLVDLRQTIEALSIDLAAAEKEIDLAWRDR